MLKRSTPWVTAWLILLLLLVSFLNHARGPIQFPGLWNLLSLGVPIAGVSAFAWLATHAGHR